MELSDTTIATVPVTCEIGSRGQVSAGHAVRQHHVRSYGVQITTGGNNNAIVRNDESAIQLRQLFDCSPQIWIGDVLGFSE